MTETIIELDERFLIWVQENIRNDVLTPVFKAITSTCDHGLLPILLCIVLMCIKKTRKIGFLCTSSLTATFLIDNIIIKNAVARIRPYESVAGLNRLIAKLSDYSFPSGHSACAFAIAVVIFMECPKKAGIPAVIFAALVAFSRIYLGVHYPSDVIAGIVTGSLFAWISCKVYHKKFAGKTAETKPSN